jgi:hypothetical protein
MTEPLQAFLFCSVAILLLWGLDCVLKKPRRGDKFWMSVRKKNRK